MGKKYYAVRNGRNTGIYDNWDSCKRQVNGYSGCSFKSFSSKSEAQAYMNGSSGSSGSGYNSNRYSSGSSGSNYNSNRYSSGSSGSNYNSNRYSSGSNGSNYSSNRYSSGSSGSSSYRPRSSNSYNRNYSSGYTSTYNYDNDDTPSYSSSNCYSSGSSGNGRSATAYVDGSYNNRTGEYGSGVVILHDSEEHHFQESSSNPKYSRMRNVAGELQGSKKAMEYCVDNNIPKLNLHYDYSGVEDWATGKWKTNKEGTKEYKEYYDSIKDKVDVKFTKVKAHSNDKYNDIADSLAKSAVGNY